MRRLTRPATNSFIVGTSATLASLRSVASRRMLLPIAIQVDDSSLAEAKLLIKWTSMTKKSFHMVPLIVDAKHYNESTAASVTKPLVPSDAPSSAKASQTFRRITLGAHELATILCVFENKLPCASFMRNAFSVKIEKDSSGVITLKGHVVPYETAGIDESKKMLFVGSLDAPTSILLKSHLESVLTEIFGIEHAQNLSWRQQYFHRQNSNYQPSSYRNTTYHGQTRSGGSGDKSSYRHQHQQQQQQPQQREVIRSPVPGKFASQLEDDVIIANAVHSAPQTPVPDPAADNASETHVVGTPDDHVAITDHDDTVTEKSEPAAAPARGKKKSKAVTKKSKSRSDKKKADSDAQELFEM
jgi:hypothetical protein